MSVNQLIDEMCGEADEAIRSLLRRAYDTGFREGLASTGQPAVSAPAPPDRPATSAARSEPVEARAVLVSTDAPPAAPERLGPTPVAWSGEAAGEAEDSQENDEDDAPDGVAVRPILPLATIGTLRRRITRTFDLERFDIDVVICRAGDPDRRQLKSSTRLGVYRREEG